MVFWMAETFYGDLLSSFAPILPLLSGECKLFIDLIETIDGDLEIRLARLEEAPKLLLSPGPG